MAARLSLVVVLACLVVSGVVHGGSEGEGDGLSLGGFLREAHGRGLISEEQLWRLLELAEGLGAEGGGKLKVSEEVVAVQARPSVFMRMYDHLTLLNVLYFSGTLLIIGAYTLFMTLAWELAHAGGLSAVMVTQVALSGAIGVTLWQSEEYQFLGGLLCCISTGMVPFTVYFIQRALNVWPESDPGPFIDFRNYIRPGWVIMEVATVLVGMGYLMVVQFPFLLAPVSFSLWFLSMDVAPLFPTWYSGWRGLWEVRRQVSLVFGVGMLAAGRILEMVMGAHPDFGFWLYLFGLITFWFSLTFDFPEYDLHGSIYFLINICLALIGSHLDRTTFHVFGTMGVVVYVYGIMSNRIKTQKSLALWGLKALASAALFAQAIRREGNIEILGALVCLLAYNFNSIHFLGSGELYYLCLLVTNLGFAACSVSFERPLSLWLFTVGDVKLPIALVCSCMVALFHAGVLKYLTTAQSRTSYIYHIYRLVASVLLSFVFVFIRLPNFAWIGGLGIPLIAISFSPALREAASSLIGRRGLFPHSHQSSLPYNLIPYAILIFGITFSNYLQSNNLYLICCLCMSVTVISHLHKWKGGGCVLAVGLIFLAVPLQSKFMITIGTFYIFAYLSYLAYEVFKNSLLFPLALVALGILLIYCGIMYQRSEAWIHEAYDDIVPTLLKSLLTQTIASLWQPMGQLDWYHYIQQTSFSSENLFAMPLNWVAWSGALVHALSRGPAPYITYLCVIGIVILMGTAALGKYKESLVEDLHRSVRVNKLSFSLSKDPAHNGHGLIVKLEAQKPSQLEKPLHIALGVDGEEFWRTAARAFGDWTVGLARSMFLPYKLTPHLISCSGFEKGSTSFSAVVQLGTGHQGSPKMRHATATNALRKLRGVNGLAHLHCTLLYSNAWYKPYSKLCEAVKTLDDIGMQLDH